MNVDYSYLLLNGFESGYFSINAFPNCEKFRVLRALGDLQETGIAYESANADHMVVLTAKGEFHRNSFLRGIVIPYPQVPPHDDRASRERAKIIARVNDLK